MTIAERRLLLLLSAVLAAASALVGRRSPTLQHSSFLGGSRRHGGSGTMEQRLQSRRHVSRIDDPDTAVAPVLAGVPAALEPLLQGIVNATAVRGADTSNQGHDSFRYEWGTWVVDASLEHLMYQVNRARLVCGAYEKLTTTVSGPSGDEGGSDKPSQAGRWRVAGADDWDCILHVLPPGAEWQGRWPTGSWAIIKALTGLVEVAALTGPDRNGNYKAKTSRDLRGGSDGSLGAGQSSKGDDCIKYVGGPLRSYRGKYGKTVLLEVVVRPPIGREGAVEDIEGLSWDEIPSILRLAELEPQVQEAPEAKPSAPADATIKRHLGSKLGMEFERVGGLDKQLDAIARRVLASRANPAAARRLGVSHVRGILLSGPPGCGKTLLARELSRLLGAREPMIVNGPEILDKYIGEAEKKVRELFLPAEQEFKALGDESALHIIILDEMDAIARQRGTMTADTTGVRDSVVNQLLAKMDGVKEASNVLVIGLTNRPELLDPALLRPGRLEVQLRVELPDIEGRRAILRIHTRQMKDAGGLAADAIEWIDDLSAEGLPAKTEHYSGAELAGLVRSAASYALGRTIEGIGDDSGVVSRTDFEQSLKEVRPALGKQDEVLKSRYPLGISACSEPMQRIMRDLQRFVTPIVFKAPRIQTLLLVGSGSGGAGVTGLAAWAAAIASNNGVTNFVRFITALDLITASEGGSEAARAAVLAQKFEEARQMSHSLLVFDDIDQLCAGSGTAGYSSVLVATLRALLRSPPADNSFAKAGGSTESKLGDGAKTIHIIATTSRADAACVVLNELFDETIVVPLVEKSSDLVTLFKDIDAISASVHNCNALADLMIDKLGKVGVKTALRLVERALAESQRETDDGEEAQSRALASILDDMTLDGDAAQQICEVIR